MTPPESANPQGEAAHPIWACDDDAIKAEYQRALDDARHWLDWHQRADSEAERLHFALENLVLAAENVCDRWESGRFNRIWQHFSTAACRKRISEANELLQPASSSEGSSE